MDTNLSQNCDASIFMAEASNVRIWQIAQRFKEAGAEEIRSGLMATVHRTLLPDSEDGGSTFLRNTTIDLQNERALQPGIPQPEESRAS